MQVVVGATVAAKWLIPEADSGIAMQLLGAPCELYAPRLLVSEVTNVLWRSVDSGSLEDFEARRLAAEVRGMSVKWADDEETPGKALRIALEVGHPVYDCMYLALALRIGASVVTADKRFVSAVASTKYKPVVVPLWQLFANAEGSVGHMRTL